MTQEGPLRDIPIPQELGRVEYSPTPESVKKFAYACEDESGWFLGDPAQGLVHPVFLANYLWWPEGFYLQEPGAVGHYQMFITRYPGLADPLILHAKTEADFINPYRIGKKLVARITLNDRYLRRGKEFVVLEAFFRDEEGQEIARFRHTVMTRTHVPLRTGGTP